MSTKVKSHASFATAAALIALASASSFATAAQNAVKEEPTRCYGINSCKGNSVCATAKSDCKGLNECKGQGVLVKTPSECKKLGGTLTEPK